MRLQVCVDNQVVDYAECIKNNSGGEVERDSGSTLEHEVDVYVVSAKSKEDLRDKLTERFNKPSDANSRAIIDHCYALATKQPPPAGTNSGPSPKPETARGACPENCECRIDTDGSQYCARCVIQDQLSPTIRHLAGTEARCFSMRPGKPVQVRGQGHITVPGDYWIEIMLSVSAGACVNGQTSPACWVADALRTDPHPAHRLENNGIVESDGSLNVRVHSFRCQRDGAPTECNLNKYRIEVEDGALMASGKKP